MSGELQRESDLSLRVNSPSGKCMVNIHHMYITSIGH